MDPLVLVEEKVDREEDWLPIYKFNSYVISNWGRVASLRRDELLKPRLSEWGYLQVCLSQNGVQRWAYVHRLVAEAFVPGMEDGLEVNHIDGDKLDNHEINLEWVTKGENNTHAHKTGLNPGRGIRIRVIETGEEFPSIQAAAQHVGITPTGVKYALRYGITTRTGWSFEYVDRASPTSEKGSREAV